MKLRSQVIRLAHTNPEMRKHLLPLLREGSTEDPWEATLKTKRIQKDVIVLKLQLDRILDRTRIPANFRSEVKRFRQDTDLEYAKFLEASTLMILDDVSYDKQASVKQLQNSQEALLELAAKMKKLRLEFMAMHVGSDMLLPHVKSSTALYALEGCFGYFPGLFRRLVEDMEYNENPDED